jgi:hypothetical protein
LNGIITPSAAGRDQMDVSRLQKITPAKLLTVTARSTTSQTVDAGRILKCVVPYRLLRDNLSPA